MQLIERGRAGAAALLADLGRVRRATFWIAVAVIVWSVTTSAVAEESPGPEAAIVIVGTLALSLALRPYRYVVLALAAGVLATLTSDALFLWPAVAALTFLSIAEDPAWRPWLGWATGITGSVVGLLWFSYAPSPAAFLATALGGASGLLLRSLDRSDALRRETRHWQARTRQSEEQARWLEQRTALARELHDVVGHHVTAMVVQAEAGLVADPLHALRQIGAQGRTALGELDALVVHLRDPEAPLAVTAPPQLSDIDELLAAPLRSHGVDVSVRVDPHLVLDDVQTLTVYRIVQESLTNVARHARANAASVEVLALDRHLRVRISDDGVGPAAAAERGAGLRGVEERVAAHGGSWELCSRLGGGTVVDVVLPLEPLAPR